MNGILITILIITGFLVYKMLSSSRKQEGNKRWKAAATISRVPRVCKVDEEAIAWCANLLRVDADKLKEMLIAIPSLYHQFWVRKRKGGYRMISAPCQELQSIQTTINARILSSAITIHSAAVGFRYGHSVVDNARPHLGKRYVLKMDIHHFFPSIRSSRVKKAFEQMGYPPQVAKVLRTLCCLHNCLPQGAPTSPALSNIIGYEMDKKLAQLAVECGLTYTRYADDLTFSGDVFPKEQIISRIERIVRSERFEPNRKKTRFMNERGRKIITGVSVSSGVKLTIPKARKREIRKKVYFILTKGLAEHQRRIGSADPVYLKRLIGELCYWRSIEPDNAYVSDAIDSLKRLEKRY